MRVTSSQIQSLYVHFPFCESKCHYCDFYSIGREDTKAKDPEIFIEALRAEAKLREKGLAPQLKTIFFGGGTPSMTKALDMERALAPLKLHERVDQTTTEWTMEANPSSVSLQPLKEYRSFGVNRVSLGVQSTHEEYLKSMGRVHSHEATEKALDALFSAGFTNVSVDLLCGIPGQSIEELDRSIETLTQFPITHLSCYLLTLPKGHFLYKKLPQEEHQLAHLMHLDQRMTEKGFHHYEISNFCKPGFEAKHNLVYWTHGSYLGLGPSAHSFDAFKKIRHRNTASLHRYGALLKKGESPIQEEEHLTADQLDLERWMLALRLATGAPLTWLEKPKHRGIFEQLKIDGLVRIHPEDTSRFQLTPKGFALSDSVIGALSTI